MFFQDTLSWKTAMVNPHVYPEVNKSRWNWDSDTKTAAHGLKSSLLGFGVIAGFTVLTNSFDYLKGLSAKLQRKYIDIFMTYTMLDNNKLEIQCLRDNNNKIRNLYSALYNL